MQSDQQYLDLETTAGSMAVPILRPTARVIQNGTVYAVLKLPSGNLHLFNWRTAVLEDVPELFPLVLLNCEGTDGVLDVGDLLDLADVPGEIDRLS